jgi:hypothetical protein
MPNPVRKIERKGWGMLSPKVETKLAEKMARKALRSLPSNLDPPSEFNSEMAGATDLKIIVDRILALEIYSAERIYIWIYIWIYFENSHPYP